jgi:CheY-like chemotaxis protein
MNPVHIVLIEDNPGDVFLIEMALNESGILYSMTKFSTGEEALSALCPTEGRETSLLVPDVILLDLNTPKSDGFEVLGKLKQHIHLAGVPVAILSSSQARSDKHRAGLMGAVRYIEKPSLLEEFLAKVGQAVKEMLNGRGN